MGESYRIIFDGGSRGNPGPSYGSYRITPWPPEDGKTVRLSFGPATNNQAEYLTLLAALDALQAFLEGSGETTHQTAIVIEGDSQLVLKQLEGEWRVKSSDLRELYERAARLLAGYPSVELNQLPREQVVEILGH